MTTENPSNHRLPQLNQPLKIAIRDKIVDIKGTTHSILVLTKKGECYQSETLKLNAPNNNKIKKLNLTKINITQPIKSIQTKDDTIIPITQNNHIYGFGKNSHCKISCLSNKILVSPVKLKHDKLQPGEHIINIEIGSTNTYALSSKGNIYAQGDNHYYQIEKCSTDTIKHLKLTHYMNIFHQSFDCLPSHKNNDDQINHKYRNKYI